jgi:hypothetical protein
VKSEGRFLFDECIGKPLMLELQSMVAPDSEFRHIVDTFRAGEKDEIWIPRLGAEGDWIVITADAGTHSKRGRKLPQLCREYSVTHVVLSRTLHQRTVLEKVAALACIWPKIELLRAARPVPVTTSDTGL